MAEHRTESRVGGLAAGGGRIIAVAKNTFREALRNRAFIGMVVLSLGFIGLSMMLSELAVVGQESRVLVDFGFFAISLFAVATAIVMGAILVHKEMEKKTIYTILSKPIRRYEFILGKYVGVMIVLVLQVGLLSLFWCSLLLMNGDGVGLEHFKGILLILMEVAVVTSIAVMFSAMSSPVLTALFTTGAFAVGRVVYLLETMLTSTRGVFVDNPILGMLGDSAVVLFPDLSVFNISQQVLLGLSTPWSYLVHAGVYAGCYVLAVIVLAVLAFQRRDFT
jgi:ABC-type transport system involved in multi-copper enzyme maturation permease subunit